MSLDEAVEFVMYFDDKMILNRNRSVVQKTLEGMAVGYGNEKNFSPYSNLSQVIIRRTE